MIEIPSLVICYVDNIFIFLWLGCALLCANCSHNDEQANHVSKAKPTELKEILWCEEN
jgi:hypothetical protein